MLTKKCKYGLKAAIFLAGLAPGQFTTSEEIAKTQNLPKRFLSQILRELQAAGLVAIKKGKGGGYCLAVKSSDIAASDIIEVLDGPLELLPCESETPYNGCDDCIDKPRCSLRLSLLKAQKTISDVFDNLTIEKMRAMAGSGGEKPIHPSRIEEIA